MKDPAFRLTHTLLAALLVGLLLGCTLISAAAPADDVYHFTAGEFSDSVALPLTGIYVSQVPASADARIYYGDRVLRPGDVVPAQALDRLFLQPVAAQDRETALVYLPITDAGVGKARTLKVSIFAGRDKAPSAEDVSLETYKNIPNTGAFSASDPEGDPLSYQILTAPTRGSVEVGADGAFTYTPAKNKVGKDSFTYVAVDPAGNTSNSATVFVEILKPAASPAFADMASDPAQFSAMWLRQNQLYSGETLAGVSYFGPEKPVSRGEFLVMVMKLAGIQPDDAQLTSGFADEGDTPQWMRPYLVSALRHGIISGVHSADGLVFRPDAAVTQAEAAVMLQNVLALPKSSAALDEETLSSVPAWAENAVATLNTAGICLDPDAAGQPLTRRDAARLLYESSRLLPEKAGGFSPVSWVKSKLEALF